jgi:hypothetical protein
MDELFMPSEAPGVASGKSGPPNGEGASSLQVKPWTADNQCLSGLDFEKHGEASVEGRQWAPIGISARSSSWTMT